MLRGVYRSHRHIEPIKKRNAPVKQNGKITSL
jgi:hypothetical protein